MWHVAACPNGSCNCIVKGKTGSSCIQTALTVVLNSHHEFSFSFLKALRDRLENAFLARSYFPVALLLAVPSELEVLRCRFSWPCEIRLTVNPGAKVRVAHPQVTILL
jgi:hypothetical protein